MSISTDWLNRFKWAALSNNGVRDLARVSKPGRSEVPRELREEIAAGLRERLDIGLYCPEVVTDRRGEMPVAVCGVRRFREGTTYSEIYAYAVVAGIGAFDAKGATETFVVTELVLDMAAGRGGVTYDLLADVLSVA